MSTGVEAVASNFDSARAFFILSPDSILSGRAVPALDRLSSCGLRVVGYRWHRLSPCDVNSLYAKNRVARSRSPFDDLVEQLFAQAESLCGWLALDERAIDFSPFDVLQRLKGPSDPCKCTAEQLRRILGATNKVMNLIHTSDDGAESVRECEALFGSARLGMNPPESDLMDSVQRRAKGSPISAIEVAFSMKGRLAQHLRISVPGLDTLIAEENCLLNNQPDRVSAAPHLADLHARQIRTLDELPETAALFEELSAVGLQRKSSGSLLEHWHRAGFTVEAWQALLLQCGGSPL